MRFDALKERLAAQKVVGLPLEELPELLEDCELLREDETHFAGAIRILARDGVVLVQEQRPGDPTLLLRKLAGSAAANALVDERLASYERMWDGCGCKVDYYA